MFTFNHFNFNVLDLERSVRFYHDALGLEPVRTKDAADGSFRLVFLGDGHSPFQLELTGLRGRTQPYDLGRGSFTSRFPCRTWTPRTRSTRPWAASALKIPAWASTSSRTRTGTGSRSCRKSESPRRRRKTSPVFFCIAKTTRLASGFRYTMTGAPQKNLRGALCWPVCALSRPAATAGRCRVRTPRTPYARRRRCPAP